MLDFGIYFVDDKTRQAAKHDKIYKGYKFKYTKDLTNNNKGCKNGKLFNNTL